MLPSAHLTQAVDDAAANARGLLQFLDGEILFAVDGHIFQRIGGGTAQTFQGAEGQAYLAVLHHILEPRLLPSSMGRNS